MCACLYVSVCMFISDSVDLILRPVGRTLHAGVMMDGGYKEVLIHSELPRIDLVPCVTFYAPGISIAIQDNAF